MHIKHELYIKYALECTSLKEKRSKTSSSIDTPGSDPSLDCSASVSSRRCRSNAALFVHLSISTPIRPENQGEICKKSGTNAFKFLYE